jgi:hypothetical protein
MLMGKKTEKETEYLFYAKVLQGHVFKTLFEIIGPYQHYKRPVLHITKNGIRFLKFQDKHSSVAQICPVYFDINLQCSKFLSYEFNHTEDLLISFTNIHAKKLLKTIKKKNPIIIYIRRDNPNAIFFCIVQNKDGEHVDENSLPFKNESMDNIVNLGEELHGDLYNKPKVIIDKDFQKIKKICDISKVIHLTMRSPNYVSFQSDSKIYSSVQKYGTSTENEEDMYQVDITSTTICPLIKLATISTQVQLFEPTKEGLPLKIGGDVGNIGTITIYIKDNEILKQEEQMKPVPFPQV